LRSQSGCGLGLRAIQQPLDDDARVDDQHYGLPVERAA
jgi:hypothetical protein